MYSNVKCKINVKFIEQVTNLHSQHEVPSKISQQFGKKKPYWLWSILLSL